ncbi:MAG: hypothetical protein U5Q44_08720 [Dehalococcoidia bacterium]|nr:hypothetical protein [Dehalococcoidia bacterium]
MAAGEPAPTTQSDTEDVEELTFEQAEEIKADLAEALSGDVEIDEDRRASTASTPPARCLATQSSTR